MREGISANSWCFVKSGKTRGEDGTRIAVGKTTEKPRSRQDDEDDEDDLILIRPVDIDADNSSSLGAILGLVLSCLCLLLLAAGIIYCFVEQRCCFAGKYIYSTYNLRENVESLQSRISRSVRTKSLNGGRTKIEVLQARHRALMRREVGQNLTSNDQADRIDNVTPSMADTANQNGIFISPGATKTSQKSMPPLPIGNFRPKIILYL